MKVTEKIAKLNTILAGDKSRQEKLAQISEWFWRNYRMRVIFCQIIGKRWSYVIGVDDFPLHYERLQLTERWGLIVNERLIKGAEWDSVLDILQIFLSNRDHIA